MAITKSKTDPRVKRTRQLIQDAFTSLMREKAFEEITVKDIAERATINRATFYAHFVDKFDILESKITESFMTILSRRIEGHEILNVETIQSIFLAVCDFHKDLSTLCQRSYKAFGTQFEHTIKEITKTTLQDYLTKDKILNSNEQLLLNTASIMLSWGLYGAAYDWNNMGRRISAESFVKQSMPLILNGFEKLL
ncbi:TetR/AcrR family transcriptional regulator [Fusibacter ferrireducens]|uniref:TetR/AcrR family transcriptional regulator n=1 Tax=Fusibacter ferrireducens TaxID=2785058 RepID=A0ABR9ZNV9_9FIRM|nr:TetR/AcrR family transcriptional regulator [Fusibacter ferrireducens]MBF4692152.1 TetR/AcrR family transcriptional regulator [Fusibacter ferrireducens]